MRQDTEGNERVAASLSGQLIVAVRYFLLSVEDGQEPYEWDFGAWHEPTMGVELVTGDGGRFSAV